MKNKATIILISLLFISLCLVFIHSFFLKEQIEYSNVKVAILDSGINEEKLIYKRYNTFTKNEETEDKFNHGTKIFNVIYNTAPKKQQAMYYDIQVLNEQGLGTVENVCEGIEKSIEFDVDIITMSLGFNEHNEHLYNCVKKAIDKNIIVVAASGDTLSSDTDYPAKYKEVLSIAAVDSSNNLFSFSSTGKIDFVAPGVNIQTINNKNEKVEESGSSIATASFVGVLMSYFTEDNFSQKKFIYETYEKSGENFKKLVYNE